MAEAMTATVIGEGSGIVITVDAEPLGIDPDRAIPFGLLVNELATNAVKHAFPGGQGHIQLNVRKAAGHIELVVADDGIGMINRSVAKVPEKRGSDYVAIFVRQLGGAMDMAQPEEPGTRVRIRLPYLVAPLADADCAAA
jgi:two-component sensor histidine kinase